MASATLLPKTKYSVVSVYVRQAVPAERVSSAASSCIVSRRAFLLCVVVHGTHETGHSLALVHGCAVVFDTCIYIAATTEVQQSPRHRLLRTSVEDVSRITSPPQMKSLKPHTRTCPSFRGVDRGVIAKAKITINRLVVTCSCWDWQFPSPEL